MMRGVWRGPLRAVGDYVALTDFHTDAVMFVCKEDIDGHREAGGTAFLVSVPGEDVGVWRYFVTAGHNVEDKKPTWVRLRQRDGGPPVDLPVPKWKLHPTADVAVAPCDSDLRDFIAEHIREELFVDKWAYQLSRGDEAVFAGLLAAVETMRKRAIPMVRNGRIGALYQQDVPMWTGQYTRTEKCAHLLDCYSVGGFSGSPCFAEKPMIRQTPEGPVISSWIALLGLVIGHFAGDNAGIAVVVPVEAVRELLDMKVFVEDRKQKEVLAKERRELEQSKDAAVLGSADHDSELERFEDLTRKLVNVPKKELDEKRKDES